MRIKMPAVRIAQGNYAPFNIHCDLFPAFVRTLKNHFTRIYAEKLSS